MVIGRRLMISNISESVKMTVVTLKKKIINGITVLSQKNQLKQQKVLKFIHVVSVMQQKKKRSLKKKLLNQQQIHINRKHKKLLLTVILLLIRQQRYKLIQTIDHLKMKCLLRQWIKRLLM